MQQIYNYSKWQKILEALKLPEPVNDFSDIISASVTYGSGGGESEAHRSLKEYVALHPEIVDLPSSSISQIEFPLPSGDCIDVLYQVKDSWFAIEVKSSNSPQADIMRGLFQCVKYRAVIEAFQATRGLKQNAQSLLVLGGALPSALMPVKNVLGIQVIENVGTS